MRASEENQNKILDFIRHEIEDKGYPPSVREICAAVGYSNTSHFYRLFTELCGMNPTQWRMLNQDAD